MRYCRFCGTPIEFENAKFCPNCRGELDQPQQQNVYVPQFEMKWYKFVIYFMLFFGAALNAINGILYLTGSVYSTQGVSSTLVYRTFSGLRVVDILFGIMCIIIAAFGVYARFRLAQFRKDGPMCLYLVYIAGAAASLLYNILVAIVVDSSLFDITDIIISLGISALMVVLNYQYFTKRAALFVN